MQSTFDRMSRFIPTDHIFICTSQEYRHLVLEQLPDLSADNLLVEPVNRNTAPAVALAGVCIHRKCKEANVVVVPSDQFVTDVETFSRNVIDGLEYVSKNDIMLTMGIKPTRPEPGYGYIQKGDVTTSAGICRVKSFTEKPEREFAKVFIESGEFLWNTGMFLANINYLRRFFLDVIKDTPNRMANLLHIKYNEDIMAYLNKYYPSYPNLSMDKAALEMSDNVYVMQCNFGWADLGTWHSIYECMQKNDDNVVIDSEVMMENCRGNIVKLPRGHVGVINGLDGYIVAEEGDVLLICPKGDSSALIRKYVNEVNIRYGEEYV